MSGWQGRELPSPGQAGAVLRGAELPSSRPAARVGAVVLLFLGFTGGSGLPNKSYFCISAVDHVLFSPATCKVFLLAQKEAFQLFLGGIFESVQFWKLVVLFSSCRKRK